MKQRSSLPSPEEYGRTLAEKRRKASGVPEVLANLARATQDIEKALQAALADMAEKTAEASKENRQALGEAIESVPLPFVLEKLEALMGAVESLALEVHKQGDAVFASMMPTERPPVDLSAVEARLAAIERGVEQRNAVQLVETPVSAQPSHMSLVVTDRDADGDISAVDVKVTKH